MKVSELIRNLSTIIFANVLLAFIIIFLQEKSSTTPGYLFSCLFLFLVFLYLFLYQDMRRIRIFNKSKGR